MSNLIYILRNDEHPSNVYKIGRTDRLIHERINELSTGCLMKYKEMISWDVDDNKSIESKIHKILEPYKLKNLHVREFFNIDIKIAIELIEKFLISEQIIIQSPKILNDDILLEKYPIIKDQNNNLWIYKCNFWDCLNKEKICDYICFKENIDYRYIVSLVNTRLLQLDCKSIDWNVKLSKSELSFKDFVLDVNNNTVRLHSSNDYISKNIKFNYVENANCDLWLETLTKWFKDPNKILFLQEFFGYLLSFNYDWRKILILQGPFNCGKYTIIKILYEIVGQNNFYPIFRRFLLSSKYLKTIQNYKFGSIHTMISEEINFNLEDYNKLLDYKHNNYIFRIETKNKNYVIQNTKHIKTIIFDGETIVEDYDRNGKLFEQLKLELEGIVKWSVDGFKRLLSNNGKFTKI